MTNIAIISTIVVALLGIWTTWAFLWASYKLDRFRHELFYLRGELFKLGMDGSVPFDDPAYFMLRTLLNGMIGRAHRFNLTTLFLSQFIAAPEGLEDPYARWQFYCAKLEPAVRERLFEVHARAFFAMVGFMVERSILMMLVLLVYRLRFAFTLQPGVRAKTDLAKDMKIAKLEEEAYFSQECGLSMAA